MSEKRRRHHPGALPQPDRSAQVDYRLFARRRIAEELDLLAHEDLGPDEWDERMIRLRRMGPEAVSVILERLRNAASGPDAILYADLVMEVAGDRARAALIEILGDRTVADRVKLAILHEMDDSGLDTDDLDLDQILSDPRGALRESEDAILRAVADDERVLSAWITLDTDKWPEMAEDPSAVANFVLSQVESLAERNDERAGPALHLFARYPDEAVQTGAITALARIGNGRALTALRELAIRGFNRPVRRAAEQAAERLARRGVRPAEHDPAAAAGPVDQIYVTSIDGAGSRILRVIRKRPSGRHPVTDVFALLNTRVGLKDIHGQHDLSAAEVRRLLAHMREGGTRVVRVDPSYAGALFRDALATTRRAGLAPPLAYCYWQDFLPPEWLQAEPYNPDLAACSGVSGTSLMQAVNLLANCPDLETWFFDDPPVYEAAERLQVMAMARPGGRARRAGGRRRGSSATGPSSMPTQGQQTLLADVVAEEFAAVDDVFDSLGQRLAPPALPEVARRLTLAADLLRVAGKAPVAAAAGWVASSLRQLQEEGATASQIARHPFILMMLIRSLAVAVENLASGLDPRINPDAFA